MDTQVLRLLEKNVECNVLLKQLPRFFKFIDLNLTILHKEYNLTLSLFFLARNKCELSLFTLLQLNPFLLKACVV